MTMTIHDRLLMVASAVLGVSASSLSGTDSPKTIGTWDSLAHLELFLALEAEFGVQFSPDDIGTLVTLHQLEAHLEALGAS